MSIINCPNCNKKTSEISTRCPHCGFDRAGGDNERQQELKRREMRDRVYHLKMISYAVITLFLVAFGWYWWDTGGFQHRSSYGPLIMVTLVAIAYLAMRVLLFRARKKLRQLGR